jgi:hypothetical protein
MESENKRQQETNDWLDSRRESGALLHALDANARLVDGYKGWNDQDRAQRDRQE